MVTSSQKLILSLVPAAFTVQLTIRERSNSTATYNSRCSCAAINAARVAYWQSIGSDVGVTVRLTTRQLELAHISLTSTDVVALVITRPTRASCRTYSQMGEA